MSSYATVRCESSRVVLAAINGGTTAIFLLIIGMPYWLVLGIWTGVVAQLLDAIESANPTLASCIWHDFEVRLLAHMADEERRVTPRLASIRMRDAGAS